MEKKQKIGEKRDKNNGLGYIMVKEKCYDGHCGLGYIMVKDHSDEEHALCLKCYYDYDGHCGPDCPLEEPENG